MVGLTAGVRLHLSVSPQFTEVWETQIPREDQVGAKNFPWGDHVGAKNFLRTACFSAPTAVRGGEVSRRCLLPP